VAGTSPFVDEFPTTMYRRFPSLPCLITIGMIETSPNRFFMPTMGYIFAVIIWSLTSVANSATCSSTSALRTGTLFACLICTQRFCWRYSNSHWSICQSPDTLMNISKQPDWI
jgi:hypothetical protein